MKNLILEKALLVWAIGVGAIAIYGILFGIFSLVTGNFTSTAAFEF
jgi:hypothetical protein